MGGSPEIVQEYMCSLSFPAGLGSLGAMDRSLGCLLETV